MAHERILVTGGAGFVGSFLVEGLLAKGYEVRVLDGLVPQVHGSAGTPRFLPDGVEFIRGDVIDPEAWVRALDGIDIVFHQAAEVGVGQSMYEVTRYVQANTLGTAHLLEYLANRSHQIHKIVVASSMSIYGEGEYLCDHCGKVYPQVREEPQLVEKRWELECPGCRQALRPVPTTEEKPLRPTSIYAVTKRDQEEMCLSIGRAYRIPTVALRYFNIYGPRQSLSNPYTGVAAIFNSRLLNGNSPLVYEDGLQSRDFVHVRDIVQANLLVMQSSAANYEVFNVGTGQPSTILDVARGLARELGTSIEPQVVHKFRQGDIRHCYADISKIRKLGFEPTVSFEQGLADLAAWARNQEAVDHADEAASELERRGLAR